jgi:hypothetical protein
MGIDGALMGALQNHGLHPENELIGHCKIMVYYKNLLKTWPIMKSNLGVIRGKIMLQNQGSRPKSL